MAISETAYLKTMWERNMCPYCRGVIREGKRIGSGRKTDGGFCSLDCFAKCHVLKFAEKARFVKGNIPPK